MSDENRFRLQTVVAPPRLDSQPLRTVTLERGSIPRHPIFHAGGRKINGILFSRVVAHPAGELARTRNSYHTPFFSMREVMFFTAYLILERQIIFSATPTRLASVPHS